MPFSLNIIRLAVAVVLSAWAVPTQAESVCPDCSISLLQTKRGLEDMHAQLSRIRGRLDSGAGCKEIDSLLKSPDFYRNVPAACTELAGPIARYFGSCSGGDSVLAGKTSEYLVLQSRALNALFSIELNSLRRISPSSYGFSTLWAQFESKWKSRIAELPRASELRPGPRSMSLNQKVAYIASARELTRGEHEEIARSKGRYPHRLAYSLAYVAAMREIVANARKASSLQSAESQMVLDQIMMELGDEFPETVIETGILDRAKSVFHLDSTRLKETQGRFVGRLSSPAENAEHLRQAMVAVRHNLSGLFFDDPNSPPITEGTILGLEAAFIRERESQVKRMDEKFQSYKRSPKGLVFDSVFGDPFVAAYAHDSFLDRDLTSVSAPLLGALACHTEAEVLKALEKQDTHGLVSNLSLAGLGIGASFASGGALAVVGGIAYAGASATNYVRRLSDAGRYAADAELHYYALKSGDETPASIDPVDEASIRAELAIRQGHLSNERLLSAVGAVSDIIGFGAAGVAQAASRARMIGNAGQSERLFRLARGINWADRGADAGNLYLLYQEGETGSMAVTASMRALNERSIRQAMNSDSAVAVGTAPAGIRARAKDFWQLAAGRLTRFTK